MSFETAPPSVPSEELSRVIGLIYDCAIDQALWPKALEAMCGLIGAKFGSIALHDPSQQSVRYSKYWGAEPDFLERVRQYEQTYAALMPFHDIIPIFELDEPANTAMMMNASGRNDFYQTRFYKEWAEPAGLKDVASTILFRSETRFCIFAMHTPVGADFVSLRELDITRLLVPHVKRAVLISDILDMRTLEACSVKSTLDLLTAAVVLTDGEAHVIHANTAARAMLAAGDPVQTVADRLTIRNSDAANALRNAIARAAKSEAEMGGSGIGVPVPFADGRPAIAHVLPLATPPLRSNLAPSVKAAVFISTADAALPPVEAIAALYELTGAERKVLASILDGRNQAETSAHLGIADSTVKTHLARIFSKTHTSNQADLAQLAERLSVKAGKRA